MADLDDDFAREYMNGIGKEARKIRRAIIQLDLWEQYYIDNVKSKIDALTNGDLVLRNRTKQGVPDPTNTEVKQARTALNQLRDLRDGTNVTAVANLDKKLSRLDPSAEL